MRRAHSPPRRRGTERRSKATGDEITGQPLRIERLRTRREFPALLLSVFCFLAFSVSLCLCGELPEFLREAWRCPPDFLISQATDRCTKSLMSGGKQTTWPWSGASLFPSAPATTYVGYGSVAESGLAQMEVVNDRKGRLPWTMEKEKL